MVNYSWWEVRPILPSSSVKLTAHHSHKYVKRILSKLPKEQLHMSTPVIVVRSQHMADVDKVKVVLSTPHGEKAYDRVLWLVTLTRL